MVDNFLEDFEEDFFTLKNRRPTLDEALDHLVDDTEYLLLASKSDIMKNHNKRWELIEGKYNNPPVGIGGQPLIVDDTGYFEKKCDICGDYHDKDSVPITCQIGDGL